MLGIWRQGAVSTKGDTDDFKQELDYIMGTLLDSKSSNNLKYLSMVQLAKKILQAMSELTNQSPAMSLSISCIVYFLARDHKSIPITETTLSLIADLMKQQEQPPRSNDPEHKKQVKVIWAIVKDWIECSEDKTSKSVQFDLCEETLCTSFLMLEALAYISTSEHSPFFKAELLSSGCLQWVVARFDKTVLSLSHPPGTSGGNSSTRNGDTSLPPNLTLCLKEVEWCLRILENAAAFDKKNQAYLISHRNGLLLFVCAKFLNYSQKAAGTTASKSKEDALLTTQLFECVCILSRVLMNLSHENELCAMKLGQIAGFLSNCVSTVSLAPRLADKDKFFDINVMMLGLLVNMVERCAANRRKLLGLKMTVYEEDGEPLELPVLEALTKLFIKHDKTARDLDEELDNELAFDAEDEAEEDGPRTSEDRIAAGNNGTRAPELKFSEDEIISAVQGAMNKGSALMEDSMMASYVALLIGCLIQSDEELANDVKQQFPNKDMKEMIEQLQRFLEFMAITVKLKSGATRSIERIIHSMQALNGRS